MSDLFHELVPDVFIHEVFDRMSQADWHTFQVLTKRPERMADVVRTYYARGRRPGPLPHVWLGTSIENDRWTGRADALRTTPAALRFVSAEPLIGPLPSLDLTDIDWIIVGGESGRGADRWTLRGPDNSATVRWRSGPLSSSSSGAAGTRRPGPVNLTAGPGTAIRGRPEGRPPDPRTRAGLTRRSRSPSARSRNRADDG